MLPLLAKSVDEQVRLGREIQNLKDQNNRSENRILELISSMKVQKEVPPQVLLQRPVILHDALGRISPFHLEFISSAKAFLPVLEARFEHVGLNRVRRHLFILRDLKKTEVN